MPSLLAAKEISPSKFEELSWSSQASKMVIIARRIYVCKLTILTIFAKVLS